MYYEPRTYILYGTLVDNLCQITNGQGAPVETNVIFHDFLVLALNWLLERNQW